MWTLGLNATNIWGCKCVSLAFPQINLGPQFISRKQAAKGWINRLMSMKLLSPTYLNVSRDLANEIATLAAKTVKWGCPPFLHLNKHTCSVRSVPSTIIPICLKSHSYRKANLKPNQSQPNPNKVVIYMFASGPENGRGAILSEEESLPQYRTECLGEILLLVAEAKLHSVMLPITRCPSSCTWCSLFLRTVNLTRQGKKYSL